MDLDLVSIIVPIYNQQNNLRRSLDCILSQEYKNIEIILVNDGSTDLSLDICNEYRRKDSRVHVISKENQGVSSARNAGIEVAKGNYITFIDADDIVCPFYISYLYEGIKKTSVEICLCNNLTLKEKNIEAVEWKRTPIMYKVINIEEQYDYAYDYRLRHVWGALYKAEVIEQLRFDKKLYVGEDAYYMSQLVSKYKEICTLDNQLYGYIEYEKSSSHGVFDYKKATALEAWNKIIIQFKDMSQYTLRGCYISLYNEAIFGIKCLLESKVDMDYSLYKYCIRMCRKYWYKMLVSTCTIKQKIVFSLFALNPKLYFRFYYDKKY